MTWGVAENPAITSFSGQPAGAHEQHPAVDDACRVAAMVWACFMVKHVPAKEDLDYTRFVARYEGFVTEMSGKLVDRCTAASGAQRARERTYSQDADVVAVAGDHHLPLHAAPLSVDIVFGPDRVRVWAYRNRKEICVWDSRQQRDMPSYTSLEELLSQMHPHPHQNYENNVAMTVS